MKERPIIMQAESVRGILEGRKSQTRRIINPQPKAGERPDPHEVGAFRFRYGQPGDRLWVKEAYAVREDSEDYEPIYRADNPEFAKFKCYGEDYSDWLSPMFMPRWASRILLELTEVRVQRVQDISEEDAIAEGCKPCPMTEEDIADIQISDLYSPVYKQFAEALGPGEFPAKIEYAALWDSINKKREGGIYAWAKSPFCWALTFKKV
jgi:hypothetical protein